MIIYTLALVFGIGAVASFVIMVWFATTIEELHGESLEGDFSKF